MNGIHDLGGMHGFGSIMPESNEPVFHHDWEKMAFAMGWVALTHGLFNLDEARHALEQMNPADYLSTSYYEHWLYFLEKNLINKGIVSREALDAKIQQFEGDPNHPIPRKDAPALTERVLTMIGIGASCERPGPAPRFEAGDSVITRNINPYGHTRLPRYARGKHGVIERVHGAFVFPDTSAAGKGENPQPLYTVRFRTSELWGEHAETNQAVYLDLWESYLMLA
jgi:nitrile hydratase subunit beta